MAYLLGGDGILGNAPAMAKAVGQLKDGEDKLTFGRAALFHARLEGHFLDGGGIGGRGGEVRDGTFRVWRASPSMPVGSKVR